MEEKMEGMSQGVSDFALSVCGWIEDQADDDELRSFAAEWHGVPIAAVTVSGDMIEIAESEAVSYPTPEKALADAVAELFKQCVMVHRYGGEICNQKEADAAVKAVRDIMHNIGIEVEV